MNSYLTKNRYVIHIKKPSFKLHVKYSSYQRFQAAVRCAAQFISLYGYLLCIIAWCTVIFLFSNQPASVSSMQSQNVYSPFENIGVMKVLFAVIPVRKCAHMFLYFVLGIFMFLFFRFRTNYPHMISLLCCYLYACSDEIHQLFVNGRSAQLTDTFIDLAGAAIGIFIVSIVLYVQFCIRRKSYERPLKNLCNQ